MSRLWVHVLECSMECGSKIEITNSFLKADETSAVAKLLGWATVAKGKGKDVDVYCPACLLRVQHVARALALLGKK